MNCFQGCSSGVFSIDNQIFYRTWSWCCTQFLYKLFLKHFFPPSSHLPTFINSLWFCLYRYLIAVYLFSKESNTRCGFWYNRSASYTVFCMSASANSYLFFSCSYFTSLPPEQLANKKCNITTCFSFKAGLCASQYVFSPDNCSTSFRLALSGSSVAT